VSQICELNLELEHGFRDRDRVLPTVAVILIAITPLDRSWRRIETHTPQLKSVASGRDR
jgi:hypothetical protein